MNSLLHPRTETSAEERDVEATDLFYLELAEEWAGDRSLLGRFQDVYETAGENAEG